MCFPQLKLCACPVTRAGTIYQNACWCACPDFLDCGRPIFAAQFIFPHGIRSPLLNLLTILRSARLKLQPTGYNQPAMYSLFQDFRYALRRLAKTPGFTAIAVMTLALGIGANTAIFTVIDAVLLRPLPYRDPGKLVLLNEQTPRFPILSVSYQNYVDWREQSHVFTGVGAVRNLGMNLTGGDEPERLKAQMLNANVFELLGMDAARGRVFVPEDDKQGAPGVAMISYGLWQRSFGGSEAVLGQT